MTHFIVNASQDVISFLDEIANAMSKMHQISIAEAVARINAQWPGQIFIEQSDIILHEDAYYWSLFIYYDGEVPDWSPDADRSAWTPKPAPARDSPFWTIR